MSEFVAELFQAGLYKRSQGRIARQVTFAAIALIVAIGAWQLNQQLVGASLQWLSDSMKPYFRYGAPLVLMSLGWWISYRLVNMPRLADFLISVEAEMNKVSWPSRAELMRSVIVVVFTIFFLAAMLFFFDFVWVKVLTWLSVINS